MSSLRQSELFAGEEWRVLYRAFTTINFNASDPPSIARSMREYLQANYPEDYNDWIESSEFMFLLELLAWLAGTLAFKTDINARENFLEVAEARESILRLARFLSYNPRRNQPSRGLLKVVEVETDDDVVDSAGVNLNRVVVQWDNQDDPDWFERFTLVMNNAFVGNNPFGQPLKAGAVDGVTTQQYRINNRVGDMDGGFSATVSGDRMRFEVVNGDFEDSGSFFERTPNPDGAFHLYYRSDGNGNASANTGFFLLFKQGELQRQMFTIPAPVENQLIDIDTPGINESDVWVQTVTDSGSILTEWEKVPALFSDNITFNNLSVTTRDLYSVVTRDDDRVSIRFSDGRFGTAPVGNIRVSFRVSNGQRYQILPQEIDRVRLAIPYVNRRGVNRTLYVTFSLQQSVANSAPRETDEQIRRRAPQVYATQNRMVSGEDYNIFPMQSNIAVKLKAVNRIYSGHSRFIDLADPTGTYQDTNVFSDDGIFFCERDDQYMETAVNLSRSPSEIFSRYLAPMMKRQEAINYAAALLYDNAETAPEGAIWRKSTIARFSSTGYFQNADDMTSLRAGAILEIEHQNKRQWVAITDVDGSATTAPPAGLKGPVTLAEPIADGATILRVIPRFVSTLPADLLVTTPDRRGLEERIQNNEAFTLWFDYTAATDQWTIGDADTSSTPDVNETAIKMLTADYLSGMWRITVKGQRYVFESEANVRWYFNGTRAIDSATGTEKDDLIRVLGTNEDVNDLDGNGVRTGRGLRKTFDLAVDRVIRYADGYAEPRRIGVRFIDSDEDGQVDNPDTFARLSPSLTTQKRDAYLFWARQPDGSYTPTSGLVDVFEAEADRIAALGSLAVGDVAFQINASAVSARNTFWEVTLDDDNNPMWTRSYNGYRYAIGRGANVAKSWTTGGVLQPTPVGTPISFQWKHYAPSDHRIDPSKTNIIDIFVLTSEYDFLTRQWIANGADIDQLPLPPTELDLRIAFSEFNNYKMFSDEIVWRPVQYKFLFGAGADPELRAQFKVVKLQNSSLSDGEIKSRVVRAINEYFDVNFWDFGATFYYTELAAYIHQSLAGAIGSVVLVPMSENSSFGQGFEVRCRSDELFVSTAQVADVTIINSNTAANLRIR